MQCTEMDIQNPIQNFDDHSRSKRKIELLRKIFMDKYAKTHPGHPITPKILSYIENHLMEALPHSYTSSDHLPYPLMIMTALQSLDKGGSSEDGISDYIETNFTGLPWQHRSFLKNGIEKLCLSEEIVVTDDEIYRLPVDNHAVEGEQMRSKRKGRPPKKSSRKKNNNPTQEQCNKQEIPCLVRQLEGTVGEDRPSRRCSKRIERIQGGGKHVKVLSIENAGSIENLNRAEAEQGNRTLAQYVQRKEETGKQIESIRKKIEPGKHQINVNGIETMYVDAAINQPSATAELQTSRSEPEKQGGCIHCPDTLSNGMKEIKEEKAKLKRNNACTKELNNLREELAELKRDMQELAAKIEKGSYIQTRTPGGQSEELPGNQPPEPFSLVVLLNAQVNTPQQLENQKLLKEQNAACSIYDPTYASQKRKLDREFNYGHPQLSEFELNSQDLALYEPQYQNIELKKKKRGRGRPQKQKHAIEEHNMAVTFPEKLIPQPDRRQPQLLRRRGRPPKQNQLMALPSVMSLDFGNDNEPHGVMQSDEQQTRLKARKARGRPRKRKFDADTCVEDISKSIGEPKRLNI